MNEFDRNISFRIMASGEKFWILRVTLDIDTLCLRAFEILNNYHEQVNENVQFFFLFLSEIKILSQAYSVRIILSNLDTIILNVKYNSVSVVSKKRKRFSRGRRWSSHESGQNREAKDRPRTATYTRPLLIICHRLSTGRAKIFLRQFSFFFHSLRVLLASFPFSFPSFRFYFFYDRDEERNRWQHATTPLSFFILWATETTLLLPRHIASSCVILHAIRLTNRRVYFYDCIHEKIVRSRGAICQIFASSLQLFQLL